VRVLVFSHTGSFSSVENTCSADTSVGLTTAAADRDRRLQRLARELLRRRIAYLS